MGSYIDIADGGRHQMHCEGMKVPRDVGPLL